MAATPEALIFDVDGTLAETEEAHRQAFNAAFAEAGLGWAWDRALYRRLLDTTGGKERIRRHAEDAGATIDDARIADLHKAKTRRYADLVASGGVPLRPGVERLIREARDAGLRLAIATTTTPANIEALLAATLGKDSPSWFDVIAAGDMVPRKKPAPDVYELALREMGLPATACLAFEDSRNGLLAARAAGLPTVVTASAYTDDHDFAGALVVLDHLGDPGEPCRRLAGLGLSRPMVDLEALRAWHGGRDAI